MGEICSACHRHLTGLWSTSDTESRWRNSRPRWRRPAVVCSVASASPGSDEKEKVKRKENFKDSKSRRRELKAKSQTYVEEEIYNLSHGWKIRSRPNEKVIEVAGLHIPTSVNTLSDRVLATPPETRTVHKLLRVMGGKNTGRKLLSPNDSSVRPMMEVVRGAVFNILQARGGYTGCLPPGRWLDLYSGTGSVGIEALSRGCSSVHFIEMDPWVISKVLKPNLEATNYMEQSSVHMMRVEAYLKRISDHAKAQPFEYISVTPPYEAVDYPTLMEQLSTSPLVGEETFVIVEYPLKSKGEMPESCGPVSKIVDRRYGRTHLAIYGPDYKTK